jgi:hypothetical protein
MKSLTLSQRIPLVEGEESDARIHLRFARPRTRGDCEPCPDCQAWSDGGQKGKPACGHSTKEAPNHCRPCPWVGCRHHLYLDTTPRGSTKLNFPERDVDELTETCSLDVAGRGELTLEQIGDLMNVTRERARQLEAKGIARSRTARELDFVPEADQKVLAQYEDVLAGDVDFFGGAQ